MKSKQKEELKEKSKEELQRLVGESMDLLFKLRIEKSQNKLKNLRQIFNERKKVALMKTIINGKPKVEEVVKKETKAKNKRKKGKE